MKKLIIIGGKGTSVNVAEQILDAIQNYSMQLELLGFCIDDPELGSDINNIPIVCKIKDLYKQFNYEDIFYIFTLYKPEKMLERANFLLNLNIPDKKYSGFIHPSAVINPSVRFGIGNVILSNCTIQSNVQLGNFNIINSNTVIEHNTKIGNSNFIAASCCIGSTVKILNYNFIGLNSSIKENVVVGEQTFIGMASNVLKNVMNNNLMYGNPAKAILQ